MPGFAATRHLTELAKCQILDIPGVEWSGATRDLSLVP